MCIRLKILWCAGVVLCLLNPLSSLAESVAPDVLMQRYQAISSDPEAAAAATNQGAERAVFCFSCHGKDGNSTRNFIPNLAAQNPVYLFTQFEKFVSGERSNYVMSRLAPELSAYDRVAIAMYFSTQTVRPEPEGEDVSVVPSMRGKQLYESMCFACHGTDGHGSQQIPRIAGQPFTFLHETLLSFHRNDEKRRDSPMVPVIRNLNEEDLQAVASWVALMP